MDETEVWKPVKIPYRGVLYWNYPYEISNFGNVRNNKKKLLKPFLRGKRKGTYLCIDLYTDGKRKRIDVHRLVAFHFVDNPDNKSEVNHLDLNPFNNRADNLEWCTRSENEQHKHFMESCKQFEKEYRETQVQDTVIEENKSVYY